MHPSTTIMRWNYRLSSKSRQAKFDIFWSCMKPRPESSLLNVGATPAHLGNALLGDSNCLVEQPEQDPRWRSLRVVGCNIDFDNMRQYSAAHSSKGFRALVADACRLPFADQTFDIVFSNAVIEHLTKEGQLLMAKEIARVGRSWFVTTPNFWYPIEMHHKLPFFQFLPRPVRGFLQSKLRTWPQGEPINLLTGRELEALFPGSVVSKLRVSFYPETLIAVGHVSPAVGGTTETSMLQAVSP